MKKTFDKSLKLDKPLTDMGRRLLDVSLASALAPLSLAASTLAAFTLLANGRFDLLEEGRRIGLDGQPFRQLRLKTPLAPHKFKRLCEVLKRVHAYDAPMIFNVLKGEMAFVGPEPISLNEAEELKEHELLRFSVRPGLTDTYKLRKRMNIAFESRSVLERAYIARRSVKKDMAIIARTVPTLILGRQAPVYADSFVLRDVKIDNMTMREVIDRLIKLSAEGRHHVAFVNAHCFNVYSDDEEYGYILKRTDLTLPDGFGIKLAGIMIGAEVRENVNGTDLFPRLCRACVLNGKSIFLLGAAPGIAAKVREKMLEIYPDLSIVGAEHGYFEEGSPDERDLIARINERRPDFLLVAMGVPRQEKWIDAHLHELSVGVAMGVGGLFDFYSGRIPRAPLWMRELGLEWTWRLAQEPQRMFRRYIFGNPRFMFDVWRWYYGQARTQLINRFDDIDLPLNMYREEMEFQLRRVLWWIATDGSLKLKRFIDVAASSVGLLALSPLFLATAAAIKIEDPSGPVFYAQERVGLHGKMFRMYKFRSMVKDADRLRAQLMEQNESGAGVLFKMKNDPRVTRVGKFIRKYSIDELPQIYNVLKGDMSIVGPRPHLVSEMEQYGVKERDRLEVTPGLTCLWQVGGRSMLDFNQQVNLDKRYIQNQSLWGDVKLILKTIPVVLSGSGAY